MVEIVGFGTRIELVSIDPNFEDISIGLYEQERDGETIALVHSYSPKDGVSGRLGSVVAAMETLGGLERVGSDEPAVRFACGAFHRAAAKRTFLEACKIAPGHAPETRPLDSDDRRSGQHIRVEGRGSGRYLVHAEGVADESESRAPAIARGLAKLAEIDLDEEGTGVAFGCGRDHDEIIGLLLVRALNLRATLRSEEAASSRGVLAAPSAQEQK